MSAPIFLNWITIDKPIAKIDPAQRAASIFAIGLSIIIQFKWVGGAFRGGPISLLELYSNSRAGSCVGLHKNKNLPVGCMDCGRMTWHLLGVRRQFI